MEKAGSFRFTYFTDIYQETFEFYRDKLQFKLEHSWDRSESDKGAVFRIGEGLIEILHRQEKEEERHAALDYRDPQGVFTGIQVFNADEMYQSYKARGVPFSQEILDQPWGHRSFYVQEPNGLVLGFFEERF